MSTSQLVDVSCPVCGNDSEFKNFLGSRTDAWIENLELPNSRSFWGICKDCGLVMQNPRPGPETYDKMYAKGGYHAHQVTEAQIRQSIDLVEYCFAEKIAFMEKFVEARSRSGSPRVLDIGCGMGESLVAFKNRGYGVDGVQPDTHLVALAQKHLGLTIKSGFFSADTFEANSFSAVFTNHAFEHFDDPAEVARGIAKVLEPGGVCFTCVPTYAQNRTGAGFGWTNVSHNWIFSHTTLTRLFVQAGLVPCGHTYRGSDNYTDELWLVVRKPAVGDSASFERMEPRQYRDDWRKVYFSLLALVPVNAALNLPIVGLRKVIKAAKATRGRPDLMVDYARSIAKTRGSQIRRFLRNL